MSINILGIWGDRERRIWIHGMGCPSLPPKFIKYSIKILNLKKIYIYFHHTWMLLGGCAPKLNRIKRFMKKCPSSTTSFPFPSNHMKIAGIYFYLPINSLSNKPPKKYGTFTCKEYYHFWCRRQGLFRWTRHLFFPWRGTTQPDSLPFFYK